MQARVKKAEMLFSIVRKVHCKQMFNLPNTGHYCREVTQIKFIHDVVDRQKKIYDFNWWGELSYVPFPTACVYSHMFLVYVCIQAGCCCIWSSVLWG